jgi:hypothetical protein
MRMAEICMGLGLGVERKGFDWWVIGFGYGISYYRA